MPAAQLALAINVQSSRQTARQLTADALAVHPDINVIFAINDATAAGALQACKERGVSPDDLRVATLGLEGDTFKDALMSGGYCKAGPAMFPEVVGRVCIEAAIAAFNSKPLPTHLVTPCAILTPQTLEQFYTHNDQGWQIEWEAALSQLAIPLTIDKYVPRTSGRLPERLGFVVPFMEHEWYRNLIVCLCKYVESQGVDVEVIDADQVLGMTLLLDSREPLEPQQNRSSREMCFSLTAVRLRPTWQKNWQRRPISPSRPANNHTMSSTGVFANRCDRSAIH